MRLRLSFWTLAGVLCIAAAVGLTAFNIVEDNQAKNDSQHALEQLLLSASSGDSGSALNGEGASSSDISSAVGGSAMGNAAEDGMSASTGYAPDTPMPSETIDGNLFIGVLRIPDLGLELPVISEWDYDSLRYAPCRYAGSAYAGDLVIAAHNYTAHFGRLGELAYGSEVSFTDVRGNVFVYQVASIETLGAGDVDRMVSSEWDLTLFTCTISGADRVTVRCMEARP